MGTITPHPKARRLTAPVRLNPTHDVATFDCGKAELNEWLRSRSLESEGSSARTYVACDGNIVVGYYCIATGSIERKATPKGVKRHGLPKFIPVALIGRLARDLRFKGTGLGPDLLRDALLRIAQASEIIGIQAVIVHAMDADSVPFYEKHDFLPCPIGERTFYLPLTSITSAL